jgi:hypothetical protein
MYRPSHAAADPLLHALQHLQTVHIFPGSERTRAIRE